jgi:hypothetical protein
MESYQTLRKHAATGQVSARAAIGIAGKDRAAYLQGLLTNDIPALTAGTGCYSAWLTPQGRMLTDAHVFESGDMILLDVPSAQLTPTLVRLDQFLFSEDVQLADLSQSLTTVWLHGPLAASILGKALAGGEDLAAWPDYRNARATFEDAPVVVVRVDQLGVPESHFSQTSFVPRTSTAFPMYAGLYRKTQSLTSWPKSLSGVIINTSNPCLHACVEMVPMMSSASYPSNSRIGMLNPRMISLHFGIP